MKKLLKSALLFILILISTAGYLYYYATQHGDQRVHIEKKQWNPADPTDQGFNPGRFRLVEKYIENRLPMVRGVVIIRNMKTVHEKYYWMGGPDETDYLHSLNRAVLHALVGVALKQGIISDTGQQLDEFFPEYQFPAGNLSIEDLLLVDAPLEWGDGPMEYWRLFYSHDRVVQALDIVSNSMEATNPALNNASVYLLSEVISRTSSLSIYEFAQMHLFGPMGIDVIQDGVDGFTGFRLRTLDLAKLGVLYRDKGIWEGKQLIPADWVETVAQYARDGKSIGGWKPVRYNSKAYLMAAGEGGQYIVFAPELDLVISVSSKSMFPLAQNSGYDQMVALILDSLDDGSTARELKYGESQYYEPVLVSAMDVPDEIKDFFFDFARDIATNDINRVMYHYARGYKNQHSVNNYFFTQKEDYRSMFGFWRKIYNGGPGDLQFVYIEKARVDGNRAYLRGTLKYSYYNMNEGSIGWFPLENLIKINGRWMWLGQPEYGAILDRDEYFDTMMSEPIRAFLERCGPTMVEGSDGNLAQCFSDDFDYNGLNAHQLRELLGPFWTGEERPEVHIKTAELKDGSASFTGTLSGSDLGEIALPPGISASKSGGNWRWTGNVR